MHVYGQLCIYIPCCFQTYLQPQPESPFTIAIDYKEQLVEPKVSIEFAPDKDTPGRLSATACGATSGRVETEVRQFKRGHYQISFVPPTCELFDLQVFWFEQEIKGSPFKVDLTPSPPKTLPRGVHVVSLPVTVMDHSGIFSAFAVDKQQSSLVQPLKLSLSEQKDYINIHFNNRKCHNYDLFLFWNKKLISGSPFKINLSV